MTEILIGGAILVLFVVMFVFGAILEDRGSTLPGDWPEI